jgi:hypothetical protein
MTPKQTDQFNNMLITLRMIAKEYQTPAQLRRNSGRQYGLEYEESLEMAYENIQEAAKTAIKGVKPLANP